MKRPKIAFIINSLSTGGAERVLSTLANNFIATYEVSIITFIATPPFYNLDERIHVIPCFNRIKPSSNSFTAVLTNYSLFKRINSIVKKGDFDILIGFMTTANVLTTLVGKANGIPVIISERTNPYHQKLPKLWKLLRAISYRYADKLVVQTQIIKQYFECKMPETKLAILPNPLSIELTNNRILNNHSKRKNIILCVGRLTRSKAHHILIKAFAQTNYTDWELWIAGEGQEHSKLQELVNILNISTNVKFLGMVKDIPTLYNTSKIFAFSSTYEGFPNALIEAMHFGLACVSTNCPTGPSELIKNGENGYLVPLNDIKDMANKLNELMMNQSKTKEFGEKSVISVKQYEEENVASKWKSIIKHLIR